MIQLFRFVLIVALTLVAWDSRSACQNYSLTSAENAVIAAYIAYYGRPPDPSGMRYWAQRLDQQSGDLESIMAAFGNSEEYQTRFAHLSSESLVRNLYKQLYDRQPDDTGLAYYVSQLDGGSMELQSIALDILFGTSGDDVAVLELKKRIARHVLFEIESRGTGFPNVPADIFSGILKAGPYRLDAETACSRASEFLDLYTTFERNLERRQGSDDTLCLMGEVADAPGTFVKVDCFQRGALSLDNNYLTLSETYSSHSHSGFHGQYTKYSVDGCPLYEKVRGKWYDEWYLITPEDCSGVTRVVSGLVQESYNANVLRYQQPGASSGCVHPSLTTETVNRLLFGNMIDALDYLRAQHTLVSVTTCGRTAEECLDPSGSGWARDHMVTMPPFCVRGESME